MIKEIFELQNPWRQQRDYPFLQKPRDILTPLQENIDNNKAIGIIGSRQVGKSSVLFLLIRHLLRERNVPQEQIFYFNLDDLKLHELFANIPEFLHFIGKDSAKRRYVFIDEAQRLNNPGLFLKEIYDLNLNIKIFFSGSSQLELRSKTREHLVGRARIFQLHRLSFREYLQFNTPITPRQALEEILVYGGYPEVALERDPLQKKLLIKDIYQSYVEKDITDFLKIDNVLAFNNLVKLLAVQTGNLLNRENLAKSLRIGRPVIEKYLDILESTFIIKRIYPFHRNYKKEITKTPKIYFLDSGLRNFVINNFNPPELRPDLGTLFENFYLHELLCSDFHGLRKINFWRTTNQVEIDFIVQDEERLRAIEVKWSGRGQPRSFRTIKRYYPEIETQVITSLNYINYAVEEK